MPRREGAASLVRAKEARLAGDAAQGWDGQCTAPHLVPWRRADGVLGNNIRPMAAEEEAAAAAADIDRLAEGGRGCCGALGEGLC